MRRRIGIERRRPLVLAARVSEHMPIGRFGGAYDEEYCMAKLRVSSFTISIDGYGAGPRQDIEHGLGVGGETLHEWMVATRKFKELYGDEAGTTGADNDFTERGFANIGAWIMGRNMFGPVRGPWKDESWRGWWGDDPPYHVPVFVLTHHARAPVKMGGETTFHFVTEGIEAALERARAAAGGKDIRLGGGVSTVRQYLRARLIDEMHIAISPVLLGSGEHLLAGIDLPSLGYRVAELAATPKATHVVVSRGD